MSSKSDDGTARQDHPIQQLLRADQVGRVIGCPRSTVYWLYATGRLKGVKLGRMLRFRPEDVQGFIDGAE